MLCSRVADADPSPPSCRCLSTGIDHRPWRDRLSQRAGAAGPHVDPAAGDDHVRQRAKRDPNPLHRDARTRAVLLRVADPAGREDGHEPGTRARGAAYVNDHGLRLIPHVEPTQAQPAAQVVSSQYMKNPSSSPSMSSSVDRFTMKHAPETQSGEPGAS